MAALDTKMTELETEVAELVGILLETRTSDETTDAALAENFSRYTQQVEHLAKAAENACLLGLQDVCLLFQENLVQLSVQQRPLKDDEWQAMEEWPALVIGYLEAPEEVKNGAALLEYLQRELWPQPLAADDAQVLGELLAPSEVAQNDDSAEQTLVITETNQSQIDNDPATLPTGTISDGDEIEQKFDAVKSHPHIPPTSIEEAVWAANMEDAEGTLSDIIEEDGTPVDADMDVNSDLDDDDDDDDDNEIDEFSGEANANGELIEILRAETALMAESLDDVLDAAAQTETRIEALSNYAEQMERFAEASESIGLLGLHQVCFRLQENLSKLAVSEESFTDEQRQLVARWPDRVLNYLQAFTDQQVCQTLVHYLQDPGWPTPLPASDTTALIDLLATAKLEIDDAEVEARQQQARLEDISLALPEDVNPELLDSLLQELPNQTSEFSTAIQRIVDGEGNQQDVDVAQRIAHTLKGAGNTVGVRGIATLTHHIEDILLALSKHAALPNRALAETLMNAADCLETMSESLLGISEPPNQAIAVLQEILDWANRIDQEGIPTADEALPKPQPQGARQPSLQQAVKEDSPPAYESSEPMLRIPASLVDELLRLVGESVILTGQVQEQAKKTMLHTRAVQTQNQIFQQLTHELEQLVDIQNVSSPLAKSVVKSDFDPLELEKYNELNTVTHRLVEIAADSAELSYQVANDLGFLDDLLVNQGRLQQQNQGAVLRTRMVPVKTVVPRLQRSVRQTCRLINKEVNLEVSGVNTLMDSNVLNDLVDPLMHMLRNAVDHGIETAEVRENTGKDPVGRIDLAFFREGNRVVVRCQDDGAGLDLQAIRATAERRGLIDPNKQLEDDEVTRLILVPGFSTRTATTQTSGRGIGMDAVYSRVKELKGLLNIKSETGKGCLLELRLPLTLISTHALLVSANKQRYALSDRGIEQILYPEIGTVRRLANSTTYQLGDDIYEFSTLEELLDLPSDCASTDHCPVLLIQDDAGATRAVMVQEVLDSRDMVIKHLSDYIPKLAGVAGATILGDGSVVAVLDLPDLLRVPLPSLLSKNISSNVETDQQADNDYQRCALIVDDSLSARRSLAQFIEDAGFEVHTAKDGLEAINTMQVKQPDLLLVDMEMPRMNGLELTSHVRANEATRNIPVIMITSRSTEKHRQKAKGVGVNFYMTKPFSEDELLQNIGSALRNP